MSYIETTTRALWKDRMGTDVLGEYPGASLDYVPLINAYCSDGALEAAQANRLALAGRPNQYIGLASGHPDALLAQLAREAAIQSGMEYDMM